MSRWRQNVYDLIGSTFCPWLYPTGQARTLAYKCAELVTPVLREGKVWTHLLQLTESTIRNRAAFARFHDENVLDEVLIVEKYAPHFPYGWVVEPD